VNTFVVFLSRVIGYVVDRVIFKTERGHGPAFLITTIVAQLVLGILASMIVMWFSRQREFRADAGGAKLEGGDAMIGALERLRQQHPKPLPDQMAAFGISGGLPGAGWDKGPRETADGATVDGVISLKGNYGAYWSVTIKDGLLTLINSVTGASLGELKKVERKSPTLGVAPPAQAVVLFDGSNTDAWQEGTLTPDKLLFPPACTKQSFGDCLLHLEFRLPFMPEARGQGRGNSGVYLQRRYECQVLDSFGLKGENNECGGFYQQQAPAANMCYPPLAWQTYDIEFTAPRYDSDGKKTQNARVTVSHNGVLIHDNVELAHETPGEQKEAAAAGPLYLQFHGNPVHYRNIWLLEKQK
jgi:hypothetical protein